MKQLILAIFLLSGISLSVNVQTADSIAKKNEKESKVMIPHGQPGHICDENCPKNPAFIKSDKKMMPHGEEGHVCDESCSKNPNFKNMDKKMIPHGKEGHICNETCPKNPKYKKKMKGKEQ